MTAFLIRWAVTTLGVFAAASILPGITYGSTMTLLAAGLLLGIINALIRPILLILSIPFILVTMGLFIFVVNALLLLLVSSLVPSFTVAGFWTAFFGSIIISIISWLLSAFFRASDGRVRVITHHGADRAIKRANAKVIDQ